MNNSKLKVEKQRIVQLRKTAALLRKAGTSHVEETNSSKRLRISPTTVNNDQQTTSQFQFSDHHNSQNKTDKKNGFFGAFCFGSSRRKRRRLQTGNSNGNSGSQLTYRGTKAVTRQFISKNQG